MNVQAIAPIVWDSKHSSTSTDPSDKFAAFLGVYLTDLVFIEDGIPSVIKNSELINFMKRKMTAEVIRDIQQYQNVPYTLNPVPELQSWILNQMEAARSVHEMYDRSLEVEPREREEEKIARLLSESGFL